MTSEEIGSALMETILEEINSDEESPDKKGERILENYLNATQSEQALMNELFMNLTGYSFETLIEMAQNREEITCI